MIYSSAGTYTNNSFMNYVFKYSNWNWESFIDTVRDLKKPVMKSSDDVAVIPVQHYRFITYMVPFPQSHIKKDGAIVFLLEEKYIKSMLTHIVSPYGGDAIIWDEDYNIITCTGNADNLQTPEFKEAIRLLSYSEVKRDDIDGFTYLISSIKSEGTGWTYTTVVPAGNVSKQLLSAKTIVLQGMLIVLLLGNIFIFYFMYGNYLPIQRLFKYTAQKYRITTSKTNELEFVQEAVEHLSNTALLLEEKVMEGMGAVKESIIQNLLKSYYHNIEDFNDAAESLNIHFSYDCFIVSIILFNIDTNIRESNIISLIEKLFPDEIEAYAIEGTEKNSIILVLCMQTDQSEHVKQYLFDMQMSLKTIQKLDTTIGVGDCFMHCVEIGKSYLEASAALDYRLVTGSGHIILFNEIKYSKQIYEYPKKELNHLELSLLSGNTKQIAETLHTLVKVIKDNQIPLYIAKQLCYDIVKTIINVYYHICIKSNDSVVISDTILMAKFESVDELAQAMLDISAELCLFLEKSKALDSSKLNNSIKKLIEDNFYDYNFTVQSIAEYFHISLSNLSHFFKDNNGVNVSDFINNKRIDYAKHLLCTTDKDIRTIVLDVGYLNSSSFIRRFKQLTGTTPGNYREIYMQ